MFVRNLLATIVILCWDLGFDSLYQLLHPERMKTLPLLCAWTFVPKFIWDDFVITPTIYNAVLYIAQ